MSEQHASLSYDGGWRLLFDIVCSARWANIWNFLQVVLLVLILWRVW